MLKNTSYWLLIFKLMTLSMMIIALGAVFFYAPIEKTMGIIQKIFYIHVPSAFFSFFAFFITFIASIIYLLKKTVKWDIVAHCSAEIGLIFCTIVLITGPIWAKPIWNVWWTWDPRLTTTLILWFTYMVYLMLRVVVQENQRSNFSAVFGIIGFLNVPLTFFAIRLWRTIHPVMITTNGVNISAPMQHTLLISFIAFGFLFFYLLMARIRLERLKVNIDEIRDLIQVKINFQ